jgi:hypothetical protein
MKHAVSIAALAFGLGGRGFAQQPSEKKPEDEAVIRLDGTDPTLNEWKKVRDMSKDVKREPGPINVQRFAGGMGWQGIPTFFNLPVALTQEDLRAGQVNVILERSTWAPHARGRLRS